MIRTRSKFAAAAGMILLASTSISTSAFADSASEIQILRQQLEAMQKRLIELEQNQAKTAEKVADTRDRAVLSTGKTGGFIVPGTNTEFSIGGYVKADLIYDFDEALGDLFVPESISVGDGDDTQRFRAHARQSRVNIKTKTPTEVGDLKTLIEGDFFGSGGNEAFSNSAGFRLRHAWAEIGNLGVGQFWTNFMPIESYPSTLDFNGPAGIPFIRQTQIRYTHPINENLKVSASLENSEFNGRDANGFFAESINFGIRAGLDELPDVTAAVSYSGDFGFLKLAGVGRYLNAAASTGGDSDVGWGLNLSGNASPWPGGSIVGSFTYGDGIGRYLINGFGQDAFVDGNGNLETIEAYGATAQVTQQITPSIKAGLAYGRYEVLDTFGPNDLEAVQTVHGSVFWNPTDRVTLGGEVIWGQRENEDGADDSAFRFHTSVQVTF